MIYAAEWKLGKQEEEMTYDEKLMCKKVYCSNCGKQVTLKKTFGFMGNEPGKIIALSFCSEKCQQEFFVV